MKTLTLVNKRTEKVATLELASSLSIHSFHNAEFKTHKVMDRKEIYKFSDGIAKLAKQLTDSTDSFRYSVFFHKTNCSFKIDEGLGKPYKIFDEITEVIYRDFKTGEETIIPGAAFEAAVVLYGIGVREYNKTHLVCKNTDKTYRRIQLIDKFLEKYYN